jgi:hypothetical protein
MARKLNLEEKAVFSQIIELADSTAIELDGDSLLQNLLAKRETALDLSAELGLWFGEDASELRR